MGRERTLRGENGGGVVTLGGSEFGEILGRAVRHLRHERGLSMEAVARRLEMSRETVRRIEFGEGTTLATLDRVLAALEYQPIDLFEAAVHLHATPSKRSGERDEMADVVVLADWSLRRSA